MGQPGVAFAGMVNWVRRNSRAVNSAIFILYIRRGGGKKALVSHPPLVGRGSSLLCWLRPCGAKADLILLPVPALSSCQDEYSVCCTAMKLHSMEYLLFALFPGQFPYLIIVLQIQTEKIIKQEWSLLVISLVL